jgi:hypothetical protein
MGRLVLFNSAPAHTVVALMVSGWDFQWHSGPDASSENQIHTSRNVAAAEKDTNEGADSRKPEYCP